MKVQYTRSGQGGAMASLITEMRVVELPDADPALTAGQTTTDGGVVMDPVTQTHGWTPNRKISGFGVRPGDSE